MIEGNGEGVSHFMIIIELHLPRRVAESSAGLVDTVVAVVAADAEIMKKCLNSETCHGRFPKVLLTWSSEWKHLNHWIRSDLTHQEGVPPPITVRGQSFHSRVAGTSGREDQASIFLYFVSVEEPPHLVWTGVIGQHAAGKADLVHVGLRRHLWGQAAKGYFSVQFPSHYRLQLSAKQGKNASYVLCLSIVVWVLTGNHGQVHWGIRLLFDPWPELLTWVKSGVLSSDLWDQQRTVLQQWNSELPDFPDISQRDQFHGRLGPGTSENPGCTFAFCQISFEVATGHRGFVSFSDQLCGSSCCQTSMAIKIHQFNTVLPTWSMSSPAAWSSSIRWNNPFIHRISTTIFSLGLE